jgi:hypothetical protein
MGVQPQHICLMRALMIASVSPHSSFHGRYSGARAPLEAGVGRELRRLATWVIDDDCVRAMVGR